MTDARDSADSDDGNSTSDSEQLWPGDLRLDDRLEFDGHTYKVVGTGPGQATLDRVDDDGFTIKVFRWAFTDTVGIELETSLNQEEFERSVTAESEGRQEQSSGGGEW